DEPVDLAAHQEALLAVHHRPLHAALLHVGVDVPDEGVRGLVVVLVGVERREVHSRHAKSPRVERVLRTLPRGGVLPPGAQSARRRRWARTSTGSPPTGFTLRVVTPACRWAASRSRTYP